MYNYDGLIERATERLNALQPITSVGKISDLYGARLGASGLEGVVSLGDVVTISTRSGSLRAEVVRINVQGVELMPEEVADGCALGDLVWVAEKTPFAPDDSWIGRVLDPDGLPLDGRVLMRGVTAADLRAAAPDAGRRRGLGARLRTGYAVFDALLPLVRGQRIGIFAGSGVGKSTLLAGLARSVDADVIVIGLVGERGRELRHFVEEVLGAEGMRRSVVVAATSDQSAQKRRRCAWAATTVAEYFREQGKQVLLIIDSVTRFAEAHREAAALGGEPSVLRGFPASTSSAIASLCERAGPGSEGAGDITAVYSVLVAGSDMEEPVADMLRGVLDGHIVLDRAIAEGGRYPAVDVLRSVSRALPAAATPQENAIISEVRQNLSHYDRAQLMLRAGLYEKGNDHELDLAVQAKPRLEQVLMEASLPSVASAFNLFRAALAASKGGR